MSQGSPTFVSSVDSDTGTLSGDLPLESRCKVSSVRKEVVGSTTTQFSAFTSSIDGRTLLQFGNKFHDSFLSETFKPSEDDKKELKRLLSKHSDDERFNDLILTFFREGTCAYIIKSVMTTITDHPLITVYAAHNVLNDIYNETTSSMIREYIVFLTTSIGDYFQQLCRKANSLRISDELFVRYSDEFIHKYKQNRIAPNVYVDEYSLLGFICQDSSDNPLTKAEYVNVSFETTNCKSFKDLQKQIIRNHAALNPLRLRGFNVGTSFDNAIKIFSYMSESWDKLSATFALRSKKLPASSLSGGGITSYLADSDIVQIYSGNYSLVPTSESQSSNVNLDVVADFDSFNQLSHSRKLQVSHFLESNRKRFNSILSSSTQLVMNNIKSKLNSSVISQKLSTRSFTPASTRSFGAHNSNSFDDDLNTLSDSLSEAYKSSNIKTFDQAIGFIVHSYIPLLKQFHNKTISVYGTNETSSIMNKLSLDSHLSIFGVARSVESSRFNNISLSGGSKEPEIRYVEKRVEVPVERRVEVPVERRVEVPVERRVEIKKYVEPLRGGTTSTSEYISALIAGQQSFNKSYEELYRKLISAIKSINTIEPVNGNVTPIYKVCDMLDSIGIKSAYTTAYISGYYGAHDYNKIYSNALTNAVEYITNNTGGMFNDVVKVLNEMIDLLRESYKNVANLRSKFISAPKSVSETLYSTLSHVKQQCSLTDSDFVSFTDACMRLKLLISNSRADKVSVKRSLDSYNGSIESRLQSINEHYDARVNHIRERYISSNNTDNTIRDIEIYIENQLREGMLYLNRVVDAKLASEKSQRSLTSISKQDLESIQKAYLAFSTSTIRVKLENTFKELDNTMSNYLIGYVHEYIKRLKKLLKQSRYVSFLAQIYREMHVFSGDFNWSEFEDRISNIIILSSISINNAINIDGKYISIDGLRHEAASCFEEDFNSKGFSVTYDPGSGAKKFLKAKNAAYIMLYNVFEEINFSSFKQHYKTDAATILFGNEFEEFKTELGCGGYSTTDKATYISKFKDYYSRLGLSNPDPSTYAQLIPDDATTDRGFIKKCFIAPTYEIGRFFRDDTNLKANINTATPISTNNGFDLTNNDVGNILSIFPYKFDILATSTGLNTIVVSNLNTYNAENIGLNPAGGAIDTLGTTKSSILSSLFNTTLNGVGDLVTKEFVIVKTLFAYTKLMRVFGEAVKDEDHKSLPYYIKHLPIYLSALYKMMRNTDSKLYKYLSKSVEVTNQYTVSFCKPRHELSIVKLTFEALMADIVGTVDDVWAVKYTGNGNLPLNLNTVLTGGDIQRGGSFFDIPNLQLDISASEVIPDAVPFYICGFHIMKHYFTAFRNKYDVADTHRMYIEISKVSQLYPAFDIFKHATITEITGNNIDTHQVQVIVSVLNKYWEQTSGEPSKKLSAGIDLLLNELNANFIFTDKIQLDIMKTTNTISKITIDMINERAESIVSAMQKYLSDAIIDTSVPMEVQSAQLEKMLSNAYNKVKNEPARSRLGMLKSLLNEDKKEINSLEDFYKFMELVVSPLLVCAISYNNIFSLFDYNTYSTTDDTSISIDFSKIDMYYKDIVFDESRRTNVLGMGGANPTGNQLNNGGLVVECKSNAWDVIHMIKTNTRPELKGLFIENPMVLKYNKILLMQALHEMHESKHFRIPEFWIVIDENTYPKSNILSCTFNKSVNKCHNIALIKQLWPNIKSDSLGAYFRQCIRDYAHDCKHYVENFLAYPGLSDRARHIISEHVKSTLSEDKLLQGSGLGADQEAFKQQYGVMDKIMIKPLSYYVYPPDYPHEFKLVSFYNGSTLAEPLLLTANTKTFTTVPGKRGEDTLSEEDKQNIYIDGTSTYIDMVGRGRLGLFHKCNYTWMDWVIFMLASCDKVNNCIPYKLILMMLDSTTLATTLREPPTEAKSRHLLYNFASQTSLDNVVTQNILARSMSLLNKDRMEYSKLNASWIASLVSVTPYIISTLQAYAQTMSSSVTYNGTNVLSMLSSLIEILTVFYNDISAYMPFIPFMSTGIQFTSTVRTKPLGELVSFIKNYSVSNMTINEYVQLEWANKWFFTGFDSIAFPEYKNKNRFEWIQTFAGSKINDPVFSDSFNTTLQVLARNVWGSIIAKSADIVNNTFDIEYRDIDEIVTKTINYMCECDTLIIEKYVNNVIDQYYSASKQPIQNISKEQEAAQNGSLFGGNIENISSTMHVRDEYKSFVRSLVAGIIPSEAIIDAPSELSELTQKEASTRELAVEKVLENKMVLALAIHACPNKCKELIEANANGSSYAVSMKDIYGRKRYSYVINNAKKFAIAESKKYVINNLHNNAKADGSDFMKAFNIRDQLSLTIGRDYANDLHTIAIKYLNDPNGAILGYEDNLINTTTRRINKYSNGANNYLSTGIINDNTTTLAETYDKINPIPYYLVPFDTRYDVVMNRLSDYYHVRLLDFPYINAYDALTSTKSVSSMLTNIINKHIKNVWLFKEMIMKNNDMLHTAMAANNTNHDLHVLNAVNQLKPPDRPLDPGDTPYNRDDLLFIKQGGDGAARTARIPELCKHFSADGVRLYRDRIVDYVICSGLSNRLSSPADKPLNTYTVTAAGDGSKVSNVMRAIEGTMIALNIAKDGFFLHCTDRTNFGGTPEYQSTDVLITTNLAHNTACSTAAAADQPSTMVGWLNRCDGLTRATNSGITTDLGMISFLIDNCLTDDGDHFCYIHGTVKANLDPEDGTDQHLEPVGTLGNGMFRGPKLQANIDADILNMLIPQATAASLSQNTFYHDIALPLVTIQRKPVNHIVNTGFLVAGSNGGGADANADVSGNIGLANNHTAAAIPMFIKDYFLNEFTDATGNIPLFITNAGVLQNHDNIGCVARYLFKDLFTDDSFQLMYRRLMRYFILFMIGRECGLPNYASNLSSNNFNDAAFHSTIGAASPFNGLGDGSEMDKLLLQHYVQCACYMQTVEDKATDGYDGGGGRIAVAAYDAHDSDNAQLGKFATYAAAADPLYPRPNHGYRMLKAYVDVRKYITDYIKSWFSTKCDLITHVAAGSIIREVNELIYSTILNNNPTGCQDIFHADASLSAANGGTISGAGGDVHANIINLIKNYLGIPVCQLNNAFGNSNIFPNQRIYTLNANALVVNDLFNGGVDYTAANQRALGHRNGAGLNDAKLFNRTNTYLDKGKDLLINMQNDKSVLLTKLNDCMKKILANNNARLDNLHSIYNYTDPILVNVFNDNIKDKQTYDIYSEFYTAMSDYIYQLSNLTIKYAILAGAICANPDIRGSFQNGFVGINTFLPLNNTQYIDLYMPILKAPTSENGYEFVFNIKTCNKLVQSATRTICYYEMASRIQTYVLSVYTGKYFLNMNNNDTLIVASVGNVYRYVYFSILKSFANVTRSLLHVNDTGDLISQISVDLYKTEYIDVISSMMTRVTPVVFYNKLEIQFYESILLYGLMPNVNFAAAIPGGANFGPTGPVSAWSGADNVSIAKSISLTQLAITMRTFDTIINAVNQLALVDNAGAYTDVLNHDLSAPANTTRAHLIALIKTRYDALIATINTLNRNIGDAEAIGSMKMRGGLYGGGLYDETRERIVYAVAVGISKCIKNRSIYTDSQQTNESYPVLHNGTNPAPVEAYLYKYLYKPSLISNYNKTPLTDYEFIVRVCAKNELFILDPKNILLSDTSYNTFSPDDITDIAKCKLDDFYEKIATSAGVSEVDITDQENIIQSKLLSHIIPVTSTNTKKVNNILKHAFNEKHAVPTAVKRTITFVNLNRIEPDTTENFDAYGTNVFNVANWFADDLTTTVVNAAAVLPFNRNVIDTVYTRNDAFMKPVQHKVTLSDKMFIYVPWCPIVSQHIFSPQKDIYNATLISQSQLISPTIYIPDKANFETYHATDNVLMIQYFKHCDNYNTIYTPTPLTFNLSHNYNKSETVSLSKFISKLIDVSTTSLFSADMNISKFNNTGFNLGLYDPNEHNEKLYLDDIVGRIESYDQDEYANLAQLYHTKDITTANNRSRGYQLYNLLFKNNPTVDNAKYVFAMIMNYFNKRVISFNGMFDNICFPSIIYGSSVFRFALHELANWSKSLRFGDIDPKHSTYETDSMLTINYYINNIVSNTSSHKAPFHDTVMNQAYEYYYQVIAKGGNSRDLRMTMRSITKEFRKNTDDHKDYKVPVIEENRPVNINKYAYLWLSNQYSSLSTNPGFFDELVLRLTPNSTTDSNVSRLFTSGIGCMFRFLDESATFLNILFTMLQATSHYNIDYDADINMFSNVKSEPFSQ